MLQWRYEHDYSYSTFASSWSVRSAKPNLWRRPAEICLGLSGGPSSWRNRNSPWRGMGKMNAEHFKELVKQIDGGKKLPGATYLHRDGLYMAPRELQQFVSELNWPVRYFQTESVPLPHWNVVKFCRWESNGSALSLMYYRDFEKADHPELVMSCQYGFTGVRLKDPRFYPNNPPILHRKELMVGKRHPKFVDWCCVTLAEEKKGWYKNASKIGTRDGWRNVSMTP